MVATYDTLAATLGIPLWALTLIIIWSAIWKLLAMWKSARNNHKIWFVVLALINTIGILEILYIYVFSKMGRKITSHPVRKIKKSRRKKR